MGVGAVMANVEVGIGVTMVNVVEVGISAIMFVTCSSPLKTGKR